MQKMILIKGANVMDEGGLRRMDVLVDGERVARMADSIEPQSGWQVVPAEGKLLHYGFCDLHVHFREPGQEQKETIATGSRAAARGGYTTVCAMPNLSPAPDAPATLAAEQERIDATAVVDVRPYATLTLGRRGQQPVDMAALHSHAVAFSDDGSGIQTADTMRALMRQAAAEDVIIAAHCEDNTLLHGGYIHDGRYAHAHGHRGICSESEWGQIARDLELALETGARYHVCHISTAESVDLLRRYKQRGARVTCETGPHYLTLCEDDLQEDGRFKMNPPLRAASDRDALIAGLLDGTIDAVATDHAPHTAEEKGRGLEKSPFGIVGLETAFPVLYTRLVRPGILRLDQLLALLCDQPRRIFRIGGQLAPGEYADLTLFDLDQEYEIRPEEFLSMGHSTPFAGWRVFGRCLLTLYRGEVVYCDSSPINTPICRCLA